MIYSAAAVGIVVNWREKNRTMGSHAAIASNWRHPFCGNGRVVRSIELEAGEFLLLLLEKELQCVADFEFFEDGAESGLRNLVYI